MTADTSYQNQIRLGCRCVKLVPGLFFALSLFTSLPTAAQDLQGKLLETRESKYNSIFIYQNGDFVSMTFGHNKRIFTESIYDTKDERDLPVVYTRFMTTPIAYVSDLSNIVEIGFGGGRTDWYLHKYLPETRVSSVELDPDVVALAKKYFGIREESNFSVTVQDGRLFLDNTVRLYDIILIDAYRGPFVPFHLLTKEFYEVVKSRLRPGGVVAQNVEPTTMLFDAAIATIKAVFENVDLYDGEGNVVIVAYDGPSRSEADLMASAEERQHQFRFKYSLPDLISQRQVLTRVPDAQVLTDDFAPVESLKAIERHNQKLDSLTAQAK
jgi:spermidine synthase